LQQQLPLLRLLLANCCFFGTGHLSSAVGFHWPWTRMQHRRADCMLHHDSISHQLPQRAHLSSAVGFHWPPMSATCAAVTTISSATLERFAAALITPTCLGASPWIAADYKLRFPDRDRRVAPRPNETCPSGTTLLEVSLDRADLKTAVRRLVWPSRMMRALNTVQKRSRSTDTAASHLLFRRHARNVPAGGPLVARFHFRFRCRLVPCRKLCCKLPWLQHPSHMVIVRLQNRFNGW